MKLLIVCCAKQQFLRGARREKKNVWPSCSVDCLIKTANTERIKVTDCSTQQVVFLLWLLLYGDSALDFIAGAHQGQWLCVTARSQEFETVAVIKHESGVMEGGEGGEMENEVVDRSPGRNHTLCGDASETTGFVYQVYCKWRHFNALCHFSYLMFSLFHFFSSHLRRWNNLARRLAVIFPFFYVLFYLIALLSTQARPHCINFLPLFFFFLSSPSFHSASRLISIPFFHWFLRPCLPHHLSSFHFSSLINTITAPLMCASPSVCP